MKLSISNIAWVKEDDAHMIEYLSQNEFQGLEIAPTRVVPSSPYDNLKKVTEFKKEIEKFNLQISSMQSIWYGRTENIFNSEKERQILIDYTFKAIDFAYSLSCNNLVFGSPKNRTYQSSTQIQEGYSFFKTIADYALEKNTCIALEPNPTIYNTNFINTTSQAIDFVSSINHPALKINLDFGTIIQNNETFDLIEKNFHLFNHIHISEPFLEIPQKREDHKKLAKILSKNNYEGYVSIEMKNPGNLNIVKKTMTYVKEVFNGN